MNIRASSVVNCTHHVIIMYIIVHKRVVDLKIGNVWNQTDQHGIALQRNYAIGRVVGGGD